MEVPFKACEVTLKSGFSARSQSEGRYYRHRVSFFFFIATYGTKIIKETEYSVGKP